MTTLAELLRRLRTPGVPGAPGQAGVPADRESQLAAELGPLLVLLDETQDRCRELRAEGEEEAGRRREQAVRQAKDLLASAKARAPGERAAAAARHRRSAATVLGDVSRSADAEVRRIERAHREHAERVVDDLTARALAASAAVGESR
jgi:hypothetical protein